MAKDIEFTARIENGAIVWDCPNGKPAKDHMTHVAKGSPPEEINFKLKDKTNLDLRFDCSFPVQVWEQNGCPPAKLDSDQIQVISCNRDGVSIVDLNTGPPRKLHYQLNVIGKDGAEHPCDPIIDNGGGGPGVQ